MMMLGFIFLIVLKLCLTGRCIQCGLQVLHSRLTKSHPDFIDTDQSQITLFVCACFVHSCVQAGLSSGARLLHCTWRMQVSQMIEENFFICTYMDARAS